MQLRDLLSGRYFIKKKEISKKDNRVNGPGDKRASSSGDH
jgi:hypothetical protein